MFVFPGFEHEVKFMCCTCEPVPVALARARLWPATPKNPHLAFTFDLLNLVEAFMLECQVSLKDFCQALDVLCPFIGKHRRDIYPVIIDSFEEYRYQ